LFQTATNTIVSWNGWKENYVTTGVQMKQEVLIGLSQKPKKVVK